MKNVTDYSVFHHFIDKYKHQGFDNIRRQDPFIMDLEEQLLRHKQFFFIADIIQVKIKFASSGSRRLLGVEPENIDPAIFYTSTHPEDLKRHNVGRTRMFNLGQQLFIAKKGIYVLSTNYRMRNKAGNYHDLLIQCYMFYALDPVETVYILEVITDVTDRIHGFGYHYYVGDDLSNFRYPDQRLLRTGNVFSKSEFDIIKLMAEGLSSQEIAGRLSLSVHTVNTHRRNILGKTGHKSTQVLIRELKERGVI